MVKKIKSYLFYFLLLAVLSVSCDVLPCTEYDGVQLNAGFYKINNRVVEDTTIDSLIIYPLNSDTVSYNGVTKNTGSISMSLNVDNDTTGYVLFLDSISYDTITFICARELNLESHECGFEYFFYLQEIRYTCNRIDSVWIRKDLVEYGKVENVKISF